MSKKDKLLPPIDSKYYLIDTHCHLDMGSYSSDLQSVLNDAFDNGIKGVISIGIDYSSSKEAVKIAKRYPMVKATAGVHPHDVSNLDSDGLNDICKLIDHHRELIVGY